MLYKHLHCIKLYHMYYRIYIHNIHLSYLSSSRVNISACSKNIHYCIYLVILKQRCRKLTSRKRRLSFLLKILLLLHKKKHILISIGFIINIYE